MIDQVLISVAGVSRWKLASCLRPARASCSVHHAVPIQERPSGSITCCYFLVAASCSRYRGTSGAMDHCEGRRAAALNCWKCDIICVQSCAWIPNYKSCLFHVMGSSEQRRELRDRDKPRWPTPFKTSPKCSQLPKSSPCYNPPAGGDGAMRLCLTSKSEQDF